MKDKSSRMKQAMKILLFLVIGIIVSVVVALLVLKSQVTRYASYWESEASKSVPENALIYVALGDSAAQGIGATSPRRGYVGLIAQSLEDKHQRPVHVVNISKSGAKLKDCIQDQLPQLSELDPDFITIDIGGNDMKDFKKDKFTDEMSQVLKGLPLKTVISDIPYFGGGRFKHLEPNVLQANEIIYELTSVSGHRVAALHEQVKSHDSLNTFAVDLFHPSNAGYKNWHNAFWEILRRDESAILP